MKLKEKIERLLCPAIRGIAKWYENQIAVNEALYQPLPRGICDWPDKFMTSETVLLHRDGM